MTLDKLAQAAGYDDYVSYLKSPHWVRLRTRLLKEGYCPVCGETERLHLHHTTYERLGRELDRDFVTLCATHHDRVHSILKERGWSVARTAEVVKELEPVPLPTKVQPKTWQERKALRKSRKKVMPPVDPVTRLLRQPFR